MRGQQACDPGSARQSPRVTLLDLTFSQLQDLVLSLGEPSYRADQIYGWIYSSLVTDLEAMSNLPLPMRQRLAEVVNLQTLAPVMSTRSSDTLTEKVLFALPDADEFYRKLQFINNAEDTSSLGCPIQFGEEDSCYAREF